MSQADPSGTVPAPAGAAPAPPGADPAPADPAPSGTGPTPSVAANARLIAVLTAASRVAGFVRTLVFMACVGATSVGAAYQSTNTIPNVVYELAAGGVLAAVVVPLLARRAAERDRAGVSEITSALLTWAVLVLLPLAAGIALLAPVLAEGLLPADQAEMGTRMLMVFAPQIVLYGVGIVVSGVLQAHERFAAAALAPLVSSVVVIATYAGYALAVGRGEQDGAIWVLAVGTTLGVVALVATLVPSARALHLRLRPTLTFPAGVAQRARRLAGAGLIALLAQQAHIVVVLWLTNQRAGTGAINTYQYVQAVYVLPYAVLAVPIATAAFPVFAADEGRGEQSAATLARSLRAIVVLAGAAAAALLAAAGDLGTFFAALDAGRGGAGQGALAALPSTVAAFAPGLVGFSVAALGTRALYVRGRARLGALVVAAGWVVAAAVALLATTGGTDTARTLVAIGVGSSLGMTVAALALLILIARSWGPAALSGLARTGCVVLLAGAAGAAAGWGLLEVVPAAAGLAGALGRGMLGGMVAAALVLLIVAVGSPAQVRELVPARLRRRR